MLKLDQVVRQTEGLMASGVTAIAYETVHTPDGVLPLLAPMSEVAGWQSRPGPIAWRRKTAGPAYYWVECQEWIRLMC